MGGHDPSSSDRGPDAPGEAFSYFDPGVPGHARDATSDPSITHFDDLVSYEIARGLFFRPVYAENVSLNFVTFPPNSGFPTHVHPEEQISIVSEGEMEISVGELRRMVHPGDVVIYPSNMPHSGRTFDQRCRLIDIFSPPRTGIQDVIAGADPVREPDTERWWYPEA